jgi:hypothetical protein
MKKFQLKVTSQVPRIFMANITIEAETLEAAEAEAQRRYEGDEIEWERDWGVWDDADFEVEEVEEA